MLFMVVCNQIGDGGWIVQVDQVKVVFGILVYDVEIESFFYLKFRVGYRVFDFKFCNFCFIFVSFKEGYYY